MHVIVRVAAVALLGTGAPLLSQTPLAASGAAVLAEPAVSPDGREIAFVAAGDIWTVPVRGGEARAIVAHDAAESRPLFSPDGKRLAFVSNRTGNGDIYVLNRADRTVRRLTFDDVSESLEGWSRDGRYVYLSTTSRDISSMRDVLRIPADGGTPMPVAADRYASEYWAAPSPRDPATVALTVRGNGVAQWWRHGRSHLDETEIWLLRDGAPPRYEPFVGGGAKYAWPMWSADGRTLFYVSDKSGADNIYARTLAGADRTVTSFPDGRVLWPTISADGRTIVFERGFRIWRLDPNTGRTNEVPIRLGPAVPTPAEQLRLTGGVQWLALSPDGRTIAFTARGEVFTVSAREGGEATRITSEPGDDGEVQWSPDGRRLVFSSDRSGTTRLYTYDVAAGRTAPLTAGPGPDNCPMWSPDGQSVAFIRQGRELRVVDVATKVERVIVTGFFDREPFVSWRALAWSPDGRNIAYFTNTAGLSNVFIVPAAGGVSRPVSFLPNVFGASVSWSADGRFLLMDSRQRGEEGIAVRIDVGGRDRMTILPAGLDISRTIPSPDSRAALLTATAGRATNLYTYLLEDTAATTTPRQITSTAGGKGFAQWSPDSREVYFIEGGRINAVDVETRAVRRIDFTARLEVSFATDKQVLFRQTWNYLNNNFYDPGFNGVDWAGVRVQYAPFVAGSRSSEDLRRVLSLMTGELNASHVTVIGRAFAPATPAGRIGVSFDRYRYESDGGFIVSSVLPASPAADADIVAGDALVGVDGRLLGRQTNLDSVLAGKVARPVTLSIVHDGARRDVSLRPITTAAEKNLMYREWVERNRAYVDRVSGGRLGYVHMPDMNETSISRLHMDLNATTRARAGVVVDLRNNNGGFLNADALDVFARQSYALLQARGAEAPASARTILGQRSLERPTVLMVNQHSLSDAEMFTEGYRALKLGPIVGEPTAGWIIHATATLLIDGTILQIPNIKVLDVNGQDMDRHPRPVDVAVERPMGESYTDRDVQLDAAVKALLELLPR